MMHGSITETIAFDDWAQEAMELELGTREPIGHHSAQTMIWEFRNIWLQWAFSNPGIATVAAAVGGMALFWLCGLIIYLASPRLGVPVTRLEVTASPTPATQSASNVSGGSTVNQAGGNITINNQGISEETLRAVMREKSFAAMSELEGRYPHGYVILGITANGRVIYETKLRDVTIEADWSTFEVRIDQPKKGMMLIKAPKLGIVSDGSISGIYLSGNFEGMPFVENKPIQSQIYKRMYYEVMDVSRGIVIAGFK